MCMEWIALLWCAARGPAHVPFFYECFAERQHIHLFILLQIKCPCAIEMLFSKLGIPSIHIRMGKGWPGGKPLSASFPIKAGTLDLVLLLRSVQVQATSYHTGSLKRTPCGCTCYVVTIHEAMFTPLHRGCVALQCGRFDLLCEDVLYKN